MLVHRIFKVLATSSWTKNKTYLNMSYILNTTSAESPDTWPRFEQKMVNANTPLHSLRHFLPNFHGPNFVAKSIK